MYYFTDSFAVKFSTPFFQKEFSTKTYHVSIEPSEISLHFFDILTDIFEFLRINWRSNKIKGF